MVEEAKSWIKENQALVYFLFAQFVALCAAVISIVAYSVKLETRVSTLEIRGSPHLEKVDNRLNVLETQTKENKERLERVVDVMTRKLNVNP